jgi:membrane associated rhomboid family serine protease
MYARSGRNPTPGWMRPVKERLSATITALVVVNALVFAFYALVRPARMFIDSHLALTAQAFLSGEIWQPFSSLFVHLEPISFFFAMIGLWFVGVSLERELGRRRFLAMFFVPGVLGNVATALVAARFGHGELYPGSGTAILALFVAFGTLYNRTPARILGGLVLEARVLALILVGFALVADIARGSLPALIGDVVAIGLAYMIAGGRGGALRALFAPRKNDGRRRFQVVEGGRRKDRSSSKLN